MRSPRTIEHHVSAMLGKFNAARSRSCFACAVSLGYLARRAAANEKLRSFASCNCAAGAASKRCSPSQSVTQGSKRNLFHAGSASSMEWATLKLAARPEYGGSTWF
ncbi:hypothetical protein [Mesorhizobium sp.]|uniref:hypothetical protein n=1 Tax=Mesorhizobium sp. TaxID=1871066 RepID=UPI0025D939C7|nr:hypothetical protein [Mesorhizobium sp.]